MRPGRTAKYQRRLVALEARRENLLEYVRQKAQHPRDGAGKFTVASNDHDRVQRIIRTEKEIAVLEDRTRAYHPK